MENEPSTAEQTSVLLPMWDFRCAGCLNTFRWRGRHERDRPPVYHSANCEKRKQERDAAIFPTKCVRQDKKLWRSFEHAESSAPTDQVAYRCRCGGIHLGHQQASLAFWIEIPIEEVPAEGEAPRRIILPFDWKPRLRAQKPQLPSDPSDSPTDSLALLNTNSKKEHP